MDPILAAKMIAIPSSILLGSYNFVYSQSVIPHLYDQPPAISTPLFAKFFNAGLTFIPKVAVPAIAAYGYVAYNSNDARKRNVYLTSAALMLGTLPLTQLVMMPGIRRLIEISQNESLRMQAGVNDEVVRLLKTWVSQNYFRASLHAVAGCLGLYAALH